MKNAIWMTCTLVLAACASERDAGHNAERAPLTTASSGATSLSTEAARLETAIRQVDLGTDLETAYATLSELSKSGELSPVQHTDAVLAFSRVAERLGHTEQAVLAIEALIAESPRTNGSPRQREVHTRLAELLLGKDPTTQRRSRRPAAQPIARITPALAALLPPAPNAGTREVNVVGFNGDSDESARLGTFNLDEALRREREQQCPLCDGANVHSTRSFSGSWTSIPAEREAIDHSLTVFYYDREAGQIPARYEHLLPLPVADIEKRLESGDGFYAVQRRAGRPPVVLLAAPRYAQLPLVEEAFGKLDAVPEGPEVVKLAPALLPREIQSVVRASFSSMRKCSEEFMSRDPKAGKFVFAFKVASDGTPSDIRIDPTSTLSDARLGACMLRVAEEWRFPATRAHGPTTVKYPIELSP
jgi:hypothetical protein